MKPKWLSALAVLFRLCVLVFVSYLSYRVGKITGHWEYGALAFMVTGYLSYLTDIRSEIARGTSVQ